MFFDKHQTNAINSLTNSSNKISVLTGTPGTGKTTILRELINNLPKHLITLTCCPTGKGSRVMATAIPESEPMTIHRMLGCMGPKQWTHTADNRLKADVVIVDEASMVGSELLARIIDGVSEHCRIILVGDMNQLPPVPAGCPFFDICTNNNTKIVNRLIFNFRQSEGSLIANACHRILNKKEIRFGRAGKKTLDSIREDDLFFEDIEDKECIPARILDICKKWKDYQVLAPQHSGICGVENLNKYLQEQLNPKKIGKTEYKVSNFLTFRLGDKVINKKNNYKLDVFNGYVGFIKKITDNQITINFDGQIVKFCERKDIKNLKLAYCLTIHASQGSEYKHGVIVCHSSHYYMLSNSLLYVAVSRFKEKLYIVGNKKGLNHAIKNKQSDERQTYLSEVL